PMAARLWAVGLAIGPVLVRKVRGQPSPSRTRRAPGTAVKSTLRCRRTLSFPAKGTLTVMYLLLTRVGLRSRAWGMSMPIFAWRFLKVGAWAGCPGSQQFVQALK